MRSEAQPSPYLPAPAEFSGAQAPPRVAAPPTRVPLTGRALPTRPTRRAWRAGGLCVQMVQWAAAVGGDAGAACPMGCGLSPLTDRRTHTHSATRAPPGPTRAARFCAGRIVRRARSSRPQPRPAPPLPAPSAVHGIQTREGGAPGRRGGPQTPRPRTEQPRQQVTAGRGPLGSGRTGRGRWARLVRLCAAAGPGLTPGSALAARAGAGLPRPGSSSPGQAGPGSSPARRTPLGGREGPALCQGQPP